MSAFVTRPAIFGMLLLIGVSLTGCKKSGLGAVTGAVVHVKDGSPLAGARVIARSVETGNSVYGTTDANGHFELGLELKGDGVPPGEYQFMIAEDRGDSDNPRPPTISQKYANANTSGIGVKVAPGTTETVELKLDPR